LPNSASLERTVEVTAAAEKIDLEAHDGYRLAVLGRRSFFASASLTCSVVFSNRSAASCIGSIAT
jgi:hypothetical protein